MYNISKGTLRIHFSQSKATDSTLPVFTTVFQLYLFFFFFILFVHMTPVLICTASVSIELTSLVTAGLTEVHEESSGVNFVCND